MARDRDDSVWAVSTSCDDAVFLECSDVLRMMYRCVILSGRSAILIRRCEDISCFVRL